MEFIWNAVWCNQPRDQWPVPEFSWIDARDVGLAHVRAMERPQAAGRRFIVSHGMYILFWWVAYRIELSLNCSKELSTWEYWSKSSYIWEAAVTHHRAPVVELNKGNTPDKPTPRPESVIYDNTSLRDVLGIELTEATVTLKDIVADFRQKGWIP